MPKIIGNKLSLLGYNGDVTNIDKCIEAIAYLTECDTININDINRVSEKYGVYIKPNGKMLDTYEDFDERLAKYKIVPIGMRLRFTDFPLFASFIKTNGYWEGAYIGTGTQLFQMYEKHYLGTDNFDMTYLDVFGGDNRDRDITGRGLIEILANKSNDKEESLAFSDETISTISEIEKALERCERDLNPKNSRGSKNNKKARKAERLKIHLLKAKEKQEKQEKMLAKQSVEPAKPVNKDSYESADEVNWLNVQEAETIDFELKDKASEKIKNSLEEYLNDSTPDYEIETSDIKPFVKDNTPEEVEEKTLDVVAESTTEKVEVIENNINSKSDDIDLIKSMDHDFIDKNGGELEKYKFQLKNDLILEIYEKLLIKESWMSGRKNRLGFYLKGLFIIIDRYRELNNYEPNGNGYTLSQDKTKCIINTGLLDIYGNYIYLIDHTPYIHNFYDKKVTLMYNKVNLLSIGFSVGSVKYLPEPAVFVENPSQYIFKGNIDDFDLDDTIHLHHIIAEHRDRFPAKYAEESEIVLCDRLKAAIIQAVKISKNDYRYILPKYDFYRHDLQFLIPFYLDNSMEDAPELTIVIGRNNSMWTVYTVLYTDDAYDDVRLICRPSSSWLKPTITKQGGK